LSARPVVSLTHPLAGFFPVDASARLIRNYRYAVERMMRVLGGWIALTPEVSAKLVMGRHVWDNAQHADALGRRLPELRAQAQVSEPANAAFIACLDAIEEAEQPGQTVERLVGVYRVLKPHLLATYEDHMRRANEVYEPPTRRILARCAEDERRHIAAGLAVLDHLVTSPALVTRGHTWQARIEQLLAAAGGVTGAGLPPAAGLEPASAAVSLSDDPQELIGLERAGTGWTVPEDLESEARQLAEALIAQDRGRLNRSCTSGTELAENAVAALAGRKVDSHRIVALARVGHQRLLKLRLQGPDGAVVLVSRWTLGQDGWRAAALDLVAVDPVRPD
jgi:hypothetical protein